MGREARLRQQALAQVAAERERQEQEGVRLPEPERCQAEPVPAKRGAVERAKPVPRYFTGEEIAEVLRVHVKTVERWRRRLGLPCLRLGGTIRYELSDVCSWASARKEG